MGFRDIYIDATLNFIMSEGLIQLQQKRPGTGGPHEGRRSSTKKTFFGMCHAQKKQITSSDPHHEGCQVRVVICVYKTHRIHVWYIYLLLVDFYGKLVGKYTIITWVRHGKHDKSRNI